jgi:nitroreductase
MLLDIIKNRRSSFSFSSRMVEPEKLDSLFEAARWAPSSMNVQPWRYIYALHEDPEFSLFHEALFEGNVKWAKDAPVLILSLAQVRYEYNHNLYENKYAWHDTGLATAQLLIQATALGLISHPMGGFDSQKARANLDIPNDYEPVTMIAIGYQDIYKPLTEDLLAHQNAPRQRKPLNDLIFKGKFPHS